jgi:hypothetical protein
LARGKLPAGFPEQPADLVKQLGRGAALTVHHKIEVPDANTAAAGDRFDGQPAQLDSRAKAATVDRYRFDV